MANWTETAERRYLMRKLAKLTARRLVVEDGQTCPRCGDLWPWNYVRCNSCGKRLA